MKNLLTGSLKCFVCALLISVFINSCNKYTGPSEPVITLTSPSDTTIINAGDTVLLKATVSDNKSPHEVYITFKNTDEDSVLLYEHPYIHGAKNYNFSVIWITGSAASYQLMVEADDHESHTTVIQFPLIVN